MSCPEPKVRLWVCTDHDAHYPVGCASIVMAHNEADAIQRLKAELRMAGLDASKPFTLHEVMIVAGSAHVLMDGNY